MLYNTYIGALGMQLCMAEKLECALDFTDSTLMQHYTILVQYKIEIRKMLLTQHIRFPLMNDVRISCRRLLT